MYATTIGRTFLKAYNCKFKTEYTAKSFFEDVFVPLFFDHGILLQSQHFLFGRISKARGGAEASDRSL